MYFLNPCSDYFGVSKSLERGLRWGGDQFSVGAFLVLFLVEITEWSKEGQKDQFRLGTFPHPSPPPDSPTFNLSLIFFGHIMK